MPAASGAVPRKPPCFFASPLELVRPQRLAAVGIGRDHLVAHRVDALVGEPQHARALERLHRRHAAARRRSRRVSRRPRLPVHRRRIRSLRRRPSTSSPDAVLALDLRVDVVGVLRRGLVLRLRLVVIGADHRLLLAIRAELVFPVLAARVVHRLDAVVAELHDRRGRRLRLHRVAHDAGRLLELDRRCRRTSTRRRTRRPRRARTSRHRRATAATGSCRSTARTRRARASRRAGAACRRPSLPAGYAANTRLPAIVGALVSGSPSQYDHSSLPLSAAIAKIVHDSVLTTQTSRSHAGSTGRRRGDRVPTPVCRSASRTRRADSSGSRPTRSPCGRRRSAS